MKTLFGVSSVREDKTIDMVIQLEEWSKDKDFDRMGLEEEYIEYLQNESIDVEMKDDGSCWLYGGEAAVDITDLFNICETSIEVNGKTKWIRIEKDADGGYSVQTADSPFVAVSEEELEEMYQHLNADYEGEETVVEYNMTVDDGE